MRQPSELPPTPDGDPAEGRPDLKMPGADTPGSMDLPEDEHARPDPTMRRDPGWACGSFIDGCSPKRPLRWERWAAPLGDRNLTGAGS